MILRVILWRSAVLAALWCILTEGKMDNWGLGLTSALLTLAASFVLLPPGSIRFSSIGLAFFLAHFMSQSFLAGIRVALLALQPRLDIHPGIRIVHLSMPEGVGRVILINTLNLMPGTLVLNLTADNLHLHILDMRSFAEDEIQATETRIAKMLGLRLCEP